MKKAFIASAVLLAATFIVVVSGGWGMPMPKAQQPAVLSNGNSTWIVENRLNSSRIYGVTEQKLTELYSEKRVEDSAIIQLAPNGGKLYFVRQAQRVDQTVSGVWSVACWDFATGITTEIGSGEKLPGMKVTGIFAQDEHVWVSGVGTRGDAMVARLDVTGEREPVVELTQPALDTEWIRVAEFQDGIFYGTMDSGRRLMLQGTYIEELPAAVSTPPEPFSVNLQMRMRCKAEILLPALLVALGVCVILLLIAAVYQNGKLLAVRLLAVMLGGLLSALVMATVALLYFVLQAEQEAQDENIVRSAQTQAWMVTWEEPAYMVKKDFFGSQLYDHYYSLLSKQEELFSVYAGETTLAVSHSRPRGMTPSECYGTQAGEVIAQAAKGKAGSIRVMMNGEPVILCAQPIASGGIPVGVLTTWSSSANNMHAAKMVLIQMTVLCGIIAVGLTLFLLWQLMRMTRPIKKLTSQMEAVSRGDFSFKKPELLRDDLGRLSGAMQEMCMELSLRDYEVNIAMRSYERFVPRGMVKLLDRASVMETNLGDSKTLTGNIGILTINNRDDARLQLDNDRFVDFINDCFSIVEANVLTHSGYQISWGFGLGQLQIYYDGAAENGVHSGLDMLGEMRERRPELGVIPDFFMLLHSANFLYGLVGTEQKSFPFVSSAEMEFLGGYTKRLSELGVRMVMTEDYMKKLGSGFTTRYIGYIASDDGKYSYKFYELLDAYPDLERNLRLRYDQRLQEAIRLFYNNDFYLARNIFSTLLRVCPEDGVPRWYLFACEHFFNSDNREQMNFQLFGVD